jgi:hypothetical protein
MGTRFYKTLHPTMSTIIRPLFASLITLFSSLPSLFSQDINAFDTLLTEAPVTFRISFTSTNRTNKVTATGGTNTATTVVTPFTQVQFIDDLRAAGIIPGETSAGWSLVAVRPAAADLVYLDSTFFIYAINPTLPAIPPATSGGARVLIPNTKFTSYGMDSVYKYKELTQGQYVLSSSGTITNFSTISYAPSFNIGGAAGSSPIRVSVLESKAQGHAAITFATKEVNDVFFFALNSLRLSARGPFSADEAPSGNSRNGFIDINVTLGVSKLVLQQLYPDVQDYNPIGGTFRTLLPSAN